MDSGCHILFMYLKKEKEGVVTGRIQIRRSFAPLLSGILLAALGSLLMAMNPILGWLGFFLDLAGLALFFYGIFYMRKVEAGFNMPSNKASELILSETPKSFLKKCAKCSREIPIASEQCPFCEQKQP